MSLMLNLRRIVTGHDASVAPSGTIGNGSVSYNIQDAPGDGELFFEPP